jgi:hypothetical protein
MNRLVEKIFRILTDDITSVVRADHADGRHIIFCVIVDHTCVRYIIFGVTVDHNIPCESRS